ncbi:hypothetical protein SO802_007062 [Lithocarpus litseifolius]|uniref:Uncharacterized protein n=1 Tax=Lithocarpus litseifolius TaxID=425828 RepID=A0AAW2DPB1_9ROSI
MSIWVQRFQVSVAKESPHGILVKGSQKEVKSNLDTVVGEEREDTQSKVVVMNVIPLLVEEYKWGHLDPSFDPSENHNNFTVNKAVRTTCVTL